MNGFMTRCICEVPIYNVAMALWASFCDQELKTESLAASYADPSRSETSRAANGDDRFQTKIPRGRHRVYNQSRFVRTRRDESQDLHGRLAPSEAFKLIFGFIFNVCGTAGVVPGSHQADCLVASPLRRAPAWFRIGDGCKHWTSVSLEHL